MGEWQPIETAPKDGFPVLAYDADDDTGSEVVIAWWYEPLDDEDRKYGPGRWVCRSFYGDEIIGCNLIYWHPIPEPSADELEPAPTPDAREKALREAAAIVQEEADLEIGNESLTLEKAVRRILALLPTGGGEAELTREVTHDHSNP